MAWNLVTMLYISSTYCCTNFMEIGWEGLQCWSGFYQLVQQFSELSSYGRWLNWLTKCCPNELKFWQQLEGSYMHISTKIPYILDLNIERYDQIFNVNNKVRCVGWAFCLTFHNFFFCFCSICSCYILTVLLFPTNELKYFFPKGCYSLLYWLLYLFVYISVCMIVSFIVKCLCASIYYSWKHFNR